MTGGEGVRHWRDKLKSEVGQIWAEAYAIYKAGEPLMLSEELDHQMRAYAENFNEVMGDPLRDYLAEWLAIPLPTDWSTYEPKKRADYYNYYSNRTWGAAATYHLCIDSSVLGIDGTAAFAEEFIRKKLNLARKD